MFTPKKLPSAAGFTLVELLTVIAIIAVLMGILFPTIGSAIESAKKVQAKNDELQIVTAIKGYYTEYGKYPEVGSNGKITSGSQNADLMKILRGKEGPSQTLQNPRKIVFLDAPDAKNLGTPTKERAGIGSNGQFLDPWGTSTGFYYVSFDADYDNQVDNPYTNAGSNPLSVGVISWSLGRDNKGGSGDKTSSADAKDDVISWQ